MRISTKHLRPQTILLMLVGTLLSGCMSLPKPDEKEIAEVPKLLMIYSDQVKSGKPDEAIQTLIEARGKVTSNGKLEGGKGALFKDEARLTALIGHIEFDKKNLNEAASKWHESFNIQFMGLKNQHEVDEKNQRIIDAIATGASESAAKTSAQKTGQRSYTYTVYNTEVPNPQMVSTGMPDGTVVRIPVQVEAAPFENIVKLNNNNKTSCTATMVSPRVAISAAHCMSQTGDAIDPKMMSIKREGIHSTPTIKVLSYFTHLGENKGWDRNRRNDWLILVVDGTYDKVGTFAKVEDKIPDSILSGKEQVMLAGYSSDLSRGFYLTLHYGCKFKAGQAKDSGIYFSNCENSKGSSGAAVMTVSPPHQIISIHTAQLLNPKDDFYSVETYGPTFVAALSSVIAATSSGNLAQTESEKLDALRRENMKRIAGLAATSPAPKLQTFAPLPFLPSPAYGSLIAASIKKNIDYSGKPEISNSIEVQVSCSPDGTITERKLLKSSGSSEWDDAVLKAIDRTSVFPKDVNGKVLSPVLVMFKP